MKIKERISLEEIRQIIIPGCDKDITKPVISLKYISTDEAAEVARLFFEIPTAKFELLRRYPQSIYVRCTEPDTRTIFTLGIFFLTGKIVAMQENMPLVLYHESYKAPVSTGNYQKAEQYLLNAGFAIPVLGYKIYELVDAGIYDLVKLPITKK